MKKIYFFSFLNKLEQTSGTFVSLLLHLVAAVGKTFITTCSQTNWRIRESCCNVEITKFYIPKEKYLRS